jgi:AcrR family transcriptional regulator
VGSRTDSPRRRADAERSIARILDAAVDALANDPEASMAEVARQAGVVRATIYVHFPTREALIEAVTRRAIADATAMIETAEPARGDAEVTRPMVTKWRNRFAEYRLDGLTDEPRPGAYILGVGDVDHDDT